MQAGRKLRGIVRLWIMRNRSGVWLVFFSGDKNPHSHVEMKVGEGTNTFDALKKMSNVRRISFHVKRNLSERVLVPTGVRSKNLGFEEEGATQA